MYPGTVSNSSSEVYWIPPWSVWSGVSSLLWTGDHTAEVDVTAGKSWPYNTRVAISPPVSNFFLPFYSLYSVSLVISIGIAEVCVILRRNFNNFEAFPAWLHGRHAGSMAL